MIYKCKNCGKEYDCQTDYCDCGNNSFVIICDNSTQVSSAGEYDEFGEEITDLTEEHSLESNEDLEFLYKPKFKNSKKNENDENKQKLLPIIIFVISIIISVILIAAAFVIPSANKNDSSAENKVTEKRTEKQAEITTDINDFWDNTPAADKTNDGVENQPVINTAPQKPAKETSQKPIQKPSAKPAQKPAEKSAPQQKVSKQVPKNTSKPQVAKEVQNKTQSAKPDIKTESINKSEKEKPQKSNEEEIAKLNTYKVNLRQHLFSVFPVLTVQGSGTASVGFSVSSEGKLLNRRFISQSNNKSLNDAMYHMLMKSPTFTAPPSCYKGEEFILEMKFSNGKYSFSYIK